MSIEYTTPILNKIKEYDKIIIFRHERPDGDCTGATKGFARILRLSFPNKDIRIINPGKSDYLSFLGDDDGEVDESHYRESLGIALDTATTKRIANKSYDKVRELIKIDHHIPVDDYGSIRWVEEERSSCCEMIVKFYDNHRDELKIDVEAAKYLYTGMVTDSGRFRFRSVSGETMRLAGLLLDVGVDTDTLYANLYMRELKSFRFESYVHNKMKITENGVVYMHVTKGIQKKFGLSGEDASTSVSYMESIKGSLIWLAFIDNGDGSIRVRLRSRFVTVSELAEKYNGGGHACASGATVYSKKEMKALISDADKLLSEYKAKSEGWI
jgi:phosphoesterase RecJ-like protein